MCRMSAPRMDLAPPTTERNSMDQCHWTQSLIRDRCCIQQAFRASLSSEVLTKHQSQSLGKRALILIELEHRLAHLRWNPQNLRQIDRQTWLPACFLPRWSDSLAYRGTPRTAVHLTGRVALALSRALKPKNFLRQPPFLRVRQ